MPNQGSAECVVIDAAYAGSRLGEGLPSENLMLHNGALWAHVRGYYRLKTSPIKLDHRFLSMVNSDPNCEGLDAHQNVPEDFYMYDIRLNHTENHIASSVLSMIYLKVHAAAKRDPSKLASVAFYDHQLHRLQAIGAFFEENKALMPPNVTLDLYQFESGSDAVQTVQSILGDYTSLGIDYDYTQTVELINQSRSPDRLVDEIVSFRAPQSRRSPVSSELRESLTCFGFSFGDVLLSPASSDGTSHLAVIP